MAAKKPTTAKRKPVAEPEPPRRVPAFTTQLEPDLLERLRDLAYFERVTLREIVERALRAEFRRADKRHGGVPPRSGDVRPGRPFGR